MVVPVYDYSQPLGPVNEEEQVSETVMNLFAEARQAFYAGDVKTALDTIELAIKEMPSNPDLHQFRSLVLFTMKEYEQAASAAHVALTAGPGWNWDTLRSLFPQAEIYSAQLRELEQVRNQNPQVAPLRFLLAYHYLMLNHTDAAAKELKKVIELEPRDQLSATLLQTITGQEVAPQQPVDYAPPVEQPQAIKPPQTVDPKAGGLGALSNAGVATPAETSPVKQVKEETQKEQPEPKQTPEQAPEEAPEKAPQQAKLQGDFKAAPAEGVEFQLILNTDTTFKWSFTADGETSTFEGKYTIENNELTLIRKQDGEKLIGIVDLNEKGFSFKMKDGDPQDPGLDFVKA